jgi:Protein of unknown function (DUF1203)
MSSTQTRQFHLVPIDAAAANALRAGGGPTYVADSKPGYPCRQCLRDAEIGDELILVSHDPFTHDSPYRCASPIFLHATSCTPDLDSFELPSQLTCRQLSVRAFDDQAMMIDAAVIDGQQLGTMLDRFFGDSSTNVVHVHNASRGCWAVTVARA